MLLKLGKTGLIFLLLCFGAQSQINAQALAESAEARLSATMERLSLKLPLLVVMRANIRSSLDELTREPCDQKAIVNLGLALQKEGYRREAANAHIEFSQACNGHPLSLQTAANILLHLSDYAAAAAVATELIELVPFGDNGYYLRALAKDRAGLHKQAIDDYVTAIELFGAKDRISSVSYFAMARSHEKLNQFCDAALAVEAWVALNPARNDTSQTRTMISGFRSRGECANVGGGHEVVIPIVRRGNVVTVSVSLNGVAGTFILDTGATFVTLTSDFAQKAKVDVDQESIVKLNTANGIVDARRARSKIVRLRTLEAKDVPTVVHANAKAGFGPRIDGLLGMSFLSRFNVSMDATAVRMRTRTAR